MINLLLVSVLFYSCMHAHLLHPDHTHNHIQFLAWPCTLKKWFLPALNAWYNLRFSFTSCSMRFSFLHSAERVSDSRFDGEVEWILSVFWSAIVLARKHNHSYHTRWQLWAPGVHTRCSACFGTDLRTISALPLWTTWYRFKLLWLSTMHDYTLHINHSLCLVDNCVTNKEIGRIRRAFGTDTVNWDLKIQYLVGCLAYQRALHLLGTVELACMNWTAELTGWEARRHQYPTI